MNGIAGWLSLVVSGMVWLAACDGPPSLEPVEPSPSDDGPTGAPSQSVGSTGPVFVGESEILMLESFPIQVELHLQGDLPTPCHRLEWEVSEPDAQNRIQVKAFSTLDAEVDCIQVLEPFEARIPLGSFTEGLYSVWLNGERIGDFDLGLVVVPPVAGDGDRRPVYVEAELLRVESYTVVQVVLKVSGNLPTPCHALMGEVGDPDAENRVDVEVYSASDRGVFCIEALKPFQEYIPLGSFSSGSYTFWVNGERIGEVDF